MQNVDYLEYMDDKENLDEMANIQRYNLSLCNYKLQIHVNVSSLPILLLKKIRIIKKHYLDEAHHT